MLLPAACRFPDVADVWNASDGTGRQRWRLVQAPQAGTVYIEVTNLLFFLRAT